MGFCEAWNLAGASQKVEESCEFHLCRYKHAFQKALFPALAARRILDLYCDCGRSRASAVDCPCLTSAFCASADGQTGSCVCVTCSSHFGTYPTCTGFRRSCSFSLYSPQCPMAGKIVVSFGICGWHYCLRDEYQPRWWMDGTFRSLVFR